MALIDLWIASQEQILSKSLHQLIAFAGDGRLRDTGTASAEFREFLARVPSSLLARYVGECLEEPFSNSGLALQDVVNQIGRRLGFDVTNGRYRGTNAHIGFDGLWRLPNGHSVIVEVKTTDAYRIDLNTLAEYRRELAAAGTIAEEASSILVVVGRQDTGDLEAQIRGSRHAWDIRLISMDALLRLVSVKEDLEAPQPIRRIHQVLLPREFTRLDEIVDLIFSTAEDIKSEGELPDKQEEVPEDVVDSTGKKFTPASFHRLCVDRIEKQLGLSFLKQSRATFATADDRVRLVCAVSRRHDRSGQAFFWFAFHPHQHDFLDGAPESMVAFGCASPEAIVLIPFSEFRQWLDGLNITDLGDRRYWHVHILQDEARFALLRKGGAGEVDLTKYALPAS
jgi:hypothetical protein